MDDPAAWLVANIDLVPQRAQVLDVACGRGRNARYLAGRGCRVHAIDRDADALASLPAGISSSLIDLESGEVSLGVGCYDVVIVFNYLHRPLLPAIVAAVAPGGVLFYETFTVGQAARGRPRTAAFLLQPGELQRLVEPLRVVRSREGEFDDKCVASVVAMR